MPWLDNQKTASLYCLPKQLASETFVMFAMKSSLSMNEDYNKLMVIGNFLNMFYFSKKQDYYLDFFQSVDLGPQTCVISSMHLHFCKSPEDLQIEKEITFSECNKLLEKSMFDGSCWSSKSTY